MNVYLILIPGKQELSFSGLTHPTHSAVIILSQRDGGELLDSQTQFQGPFLL